MSIPLETIAQPHVLTIAGSDSGGGAGIQADLKTIAAFGCYGSSVITALTAQNTLGVQGVHVVPPEFVVEQLRSIFDDDLCPDAIKFGMLAGTPTIEALATFFAELETSRRPYMILDPVMVSTSGHALLRSDANAALVERLLPLVDLLTPNIPEAIALSGERVGETMGDMLSLADAVRSTTGVKAVLLKGGHITLKRADVIASAKAHGLAVTWDEDDDGELVEVLQHFRSTMGLETSPDVIVDILVPQQGSTRVFVGKKVESTSTHGTGCTLSAALASAHAIEARVEKKTSISHEAVHRAIKYTQSAIACAHPLGRGHGPLNHYHMSSPRALPPPTKSNPTPFVSHLIKSCPDLWRSYVRHPFVIQMGNGTLPLESFKHYIAQDYHYLRHYARAHALGAYKASDFATITAFSEIALHVARESTMHVAYCEEFGITLQALQSLPEAGACSAYARYMLDVGAQGDVLDVYVAVASCLIGYGEVGLWLQSRVTTGETVLDGNPYARWINDYAGEEFLSAVRRGIANLETRIATLQPSREKLERLTQIWSECVRLERNFWDMGLNVSW